MDFNDFTRRVAAGALQVPATPLALYGLANRGVNALTGGNLPGGQFADDATMAYDRGVRGLLGIQSPQTTGEVASEALGNVLIAPPRALVAAAPLADRLLRSVFVTPRSLAGRAVDAGLQTAVGSAILNYDDLFGAAPAQAEGQAQSASPPAAAVREVAPVQVASVSGVGSSGVVSDSSGGSSEYDTLFGPAPQAAPQGVTPTASGSGVATARQASPGGYDALFGDTVAPAPPPPPQRDRELSWLDVSIAAAAAATGVGATQAILRRLRGMPIRDQGALTGTMEAASTATTRGERIATSGFDETAALTGTLQRANPLAAGDFRNRAALDMNTHAVTQRIKSFWESGDMEGYAQSRTPARAWTDSVAALPADVRTKFNDYIMARNEADNIRLGTRARPDIPDVDIHSAVSIGNANPLFRRLGGEWDDLVRTGREYAVGRGLLTREQANWLAVNRSGYMPQIRFENTPNLFQRMMDVLPAGQHESLQNFKYLFDREAAPPGTRFAPPAQALEQYTSLLMRVGNLNAARLSWINGMRNSPTAWASGLVKEIRGSAKHDENSTVKVWDAGRERRFQVDDPILLTGLRAMPQQLGLFEGIANGTRRLAQAGATGVGNPFFALRGLLYDAITATITHPKGTRFGLFPGDLVGGIAGSVAGSVRGLYGGLMRSASHSLENAWRNDTGISRVLGPANVRALATRVADSWSRTTLHAMETSGALSAGRMMVDPNVRNVYTMLDVMNPNYASRSPMLRKAFEAYRSVLELVQSGARIHFFATNQGKLGVREAARMTRQLTGDPSVRGAGKVARGVGTLVPYGNVALQSAAQLGRTAAANPALFATRLGIAIGLPAMFSVWNAARLDDELIAQGQSPMYLDHMFRQQSSDQQSTFLNLYLAGVDPRSAPAIAMPNEFRPVFAAVRDGFAALTGATTEANTTRLFDNVFAGMVSAAPLSPPPVIDVLANAAGYDVQGGYGGSLLSIRPQSQSRLVGEQGQAVSLPPDASLFERAAFSSVTGGVVQSLLATAGTMGIEGLRAALLASRGGQDIRQAVGEGATTAGLIGQRSAPILNSTLWSTPQRVATQNLDAELLSRRMTSMKAVNDQLQADIRNPAGTGTARRSTPMAGLEEVKGVADLRMIPMMAQVARFYQSLSQTDLRTISDIRSRMDGTAATAALGPRQRDTTRQQLAGELMDAQRRLLERVVDFEDYLSNSYGRRIRVDRISRRSSLDDFPLLQ